MQRLRYDLVVEAVTNLRRYVDACAEETNTISLIKNASQSLKELKQIETGIIQRHKADKPYRSETVSALAEVESAIEGMAAQVSHVQDFLEKNRDEIKAMKAIVSTTNAMSDIVTTMKAMNRQLAELRQTRITAI